jgi:hypothetical protein
LQDIRIGQPYSLISNTSHVNSKRNLSSVDPSQSVVSGDGLGPSIKALKSYTINLVAKDSSGNNIGFGGETFVIDIRNKCTIFGIQSCDTDYSAKLPLSSAVTGTMIDNGDGTYSYTYILEQSGVVSILIALQIPGVYGEFYQSDQFTSPSASTNISSNLYYDVGGKIANN